MAESNLFRSTLIAQARAILTRAEALGKEGHAGHRGQLREVLIAELLQKVLPPDVKIGSGQLIAVNGSISAQTDVIIYAPSVIIPALYNETQGYFAVDSCLYTVEIKSTLDRAGVRQAYDAAVKVRSMPMIFTEHWSRTREHGLVNVVTNRNFHPNCAIFALSSDLMDDPQAELARYRAVDPHADTNPAVVAIMVHGRGYWYFFGRWLFAAADDDLREVMGLLAGIANTLPMLLAAKGRPRVGNFFAADAAPHRSV